MRRKKVIITEDAANDILEQAVWYEKQSGLQLAGKWEREVGSVLVSIERNPGLGALCAFKAPELEGVRRIAVPRFPRHLVFYRLHGDELIILRILHGARDLESLF